MPWSVWANLPPGVPLEEWRPTAQQLTWEQSVDEENSHLPSDSEQSAEKVGTPPTTQLNSSARATKKLKLSVRPRKPKPLSQDDVEDLLKLPEPTSRFGAREDSELGLKSLEVRPEQYVQDFRSYSLAKVSGLNPGNCDADMMVKSYDAIQATGAALYEEGRLTDTGRPLTKASKEYGNPASEGQAMEAFFQRTMFSINRVVGRHNGEELVPAHENQFSKAQHSQSTKTFRLGPYVVLEREPVEKKFMAELERGKEAAGAYRREHHEGPYEESNLRSTAGMGRD